MSGLGRVALVVVVLLAACSDSDPPNAPIDAATDMGGTNKDATVNDAGGDMDATGGDADAATGDGPATKALSDNQVVAVLAASDSGEIMQGNLAQSQASDARVQMYGSQMVTAHTMSSMQLMALQMRLGITPVESTLSRMLTTDAMAAQQRLMGLSGTAFDREYVNVQVMQHARVLDIIDSALLPNVRSPELRAAIMNDVRPMVSTHLQQARDLQTMIGTP